MDPNHSRHVILIATDDAHARELIKSSLEPSRYHVEESSSLPDLFLAHENVAPALVVLDSRVFGQSGHALCQRLRHSEHGASTPILILADSSDVDGAFDAGAFDCIVRPLHKTLLKKRIELALSHFRALAESDQHRVHLESIQKLVRVGSWDLVVDSREIELSAEACRILGRKVESAGTFARAAFLETVLLEDRPSVEAWFDRILAGQPVTALEHRVLLQDSSERIVRHEIEAPDCAPVVGSRVSGIVKDITSRRRAEERMAILIDHDRPASPLDRRSFADRVADALRTAQQSQEQAAVLVLDVGLEISMPGALGERVLGAILQRTQECIRNRDVVGSMGRDLGNVSIARVHEDRLAILLPSAIRTHDAYRVADRLVENLSRPFVVAGDEYKLVPCVGIGLYPGDGSTADEILRAAEAAVQGLRQSHKKGIQFYSSSLNASAVERLTLETNLSRAIARNELLVHYQPRVDIASNKIVGMEALVRWKHPELGLVHPAQFISIAEETGLIVPLGNFVLQTACETNKRWQKAGLSPIRMAVNLSSAQFRDPSLLDSIVSVLKEVGLAPDALELELTESTLLKKGDSTLATMKELKRMGLHLSIDDFGTGYSALSYLRRLPIDGLKIDQSFIREVTTNPPDAAITTSIILMGKSLKLRVVAEGVESQSQLTLLSVLECDEAQGYFFSRPVPVEEAEALIARGVAAR